MKAKAAPTPENPGTDKKKRLSNVAYVVLIVLLLLVAAGGVFAKYVYSNAAAGTVLAREFYFTSDYLSAAGETYTLNPGTTSVTFTLKNHADDLRYSADEIGYTVTVVGDGASVAVPSGTLNAGAKNSISITLSDLQDGKTYTVTATGTGGYKDGNEYKTDGAAGYSETLSATFTVLSAGTGVYKHLDTSNSAYVVLTVWTENVKGTASITFPAGLIPDATDPALTGVTNYSSGATPYEYTGTTVPDTSSFAAAYSSRTYRFFKEDTTDSYAVGSFAVSVGGTAAEASTPK